MRSEGYISRLSSVEMTTLEASPSTLCKDFMYCVCVIAVGGLTNPVKGPYTEPRYCADKPPDSLQLINNSVDYAEEREESVEKVITAGRKTKDLGDNDDGKEESKRGSPFCPQMLISEPNHKRGNKITTVPELELRKLEQGEVLSMCSALFFVLHLWTLLIVFLLVFRFLPEQSVPASLCWAAGAAFVLSQQWPIFQLGTMGQKGNPQFTIEQISHLI